MTAAARSVLIWGLVGAAGAALVRALAGLLRDVSVAIGGLDP